MIRLGSLRISFIYIFISLLWITLSDKLLYVFHQNLSPLTLLLLSSSKGYLFVLLTGLLLYKLIKLHETRLHENEMQYRTMYEDNALPMWIYDMQSLHFVSVNQAAIRSYGYSREQFLSMSILDIRPGEDALSVKKSAGRVSKNLRQSGTWVHVKADGTPVYVNISSQQISFNRKPHVLVIAQDITEKVNFEQKLEKLNKDLYQEKQKLSETQQIAKVAGWELYIANNQLVWSDELYLITGIAPEAGKNLFDIYADHIHPEDRPKMIEELNLLISTGKELNVTHRITFADGHCRYVRQVARLEYKDKIPYKVIGSVQDITELKVMELEKNKYLYSLEDTLNTMNEGFYALNRDMVITQANRHFEKETGMSNAYTIGKKFIEVFPGIEKRITYSEFVKVLEQRIAVKFEAFSRRMNKWIFVTAYPTEEGLAAYFNDITEAKEKDMRLKEALERYENVSKATQDVIYDYDFKNDRLVYYNGAIKWMNYTPEQRGNNFQWWQSIVHFEDQKMFIYSQQKVISARQTNWKCEYRIDCGGGNYKYVYDQGYFIYDDAGEPVRLIGALKDVDDLKRSYEENKRLAEIITKINNMVVVMDTESRITWTNKAFQDYIGCKPEDAIGMQPASLVLMPETATETLAYILERKTRLETFSVELIHQIKATQQWVNVEYTPLFDDKGKHTGYIAVHQNITLRKQKEERVSRQNLVLQEIAWLSSHEIRRPVASILGLTNIAKDTDSVEERDKIITMIDHCAHELDTIVHNITQRINHETEVA